MYLRPQGKSWDFNQGVCVQSQQSYPRSKQCLERKMTQRFEAKPGDGGCMVDSERVISQC